MGKTLYLECYAGISGDMAVAALLDLGADRESLMETLNSMSVPGFHIEIKRITKFGIDACDFNVILDQKHENHDHDMHYLHGHNHTEHHHNSHMENHHSHHHEHRGMKEICEIIHGCRMTDRARKIALKIFDILAKAEAKAHNVSVEEVHFHEVGAVDSIVDIVSVAVCLDNLDIENVIVPKLYEGIGTVRCQHGILPIPVPAVINIINEYGLNVQIMETEGEFVTPTGAAIVAAVKTCDELPKGFRVKKVGVGAGKREYERPSLLRAMLIEENNEKDAIYKLESNIDDCNGENLGYVMELLLEAGARDVHYMPVFMKKNRPAWMLNVICTKTDIEKLEQIIFKETTTIGIRRVEMERSILNRQQMIVDTPLGAAEVKVCSVAGQKRYYPEYESIIRICKKNDKSYSEIYHMIVQKCEEQDE